MRETKFGYYNNIFSTTVSPISLETFCNMIINPEDRVRDLINEIRLCSDKNEQRELKKLLPAVTPSILTTGSRTSPVISNSNICCVDIDNVYVSDKLKKNINFNKFVITSFLSPSGNGIKVFVWMKYSTKFEFYSGFKQLKKELEYQLSVPIDSVASAYNQYCFLSYDPDLYFNENPMEFKYDLLPLPKNVGRKLDSSGQKLSEIKYIINYLVENKIDITKGYQNWLKIGYSISNTFGEDGRGLFHNISSIHPNYDFYETDYQFDHLLNSNDCNHPVTLSSFFFRLKELGITIP